jgi:hypothetical protein
VRRYHLRLEALEERRVPAQFGVPWHEPQHLTVSFVPDGTLVGNQPSVLFQTLDAQRPTADWQAEILSAFQAWALNAHINFGVKPDDGEPLGVPGPDQEDPRFGDIRIAAVPLSPEVLSISVPHDPFLSGTWSGDILLNSTVAFDQTADLFPVLLHEVGHVLGLDHSSDPSSVMFETLNNQRTQLAPSDIAAVQSIYGARGQDPYEGAGGNETLATATVMPTPAGFDGTTPLLLYADISTASDFDVYSLTPPDGYQGPMTIRVQTAGVSLLAPRLTVYDAAGSVVGTLAGTGDSGDTLQLVLPQVDPGATYYVKIQGATAGLFGVGEYALAVNFDARSAITPAELDTVARQTYSYLSPDDINAIFLSPQGAIFHDDHHTNDTFATATPLFPIGAYGSEGPVRITASLGDSNDVDFYQFETPESPDAGASPPGYQTGTAAPPDQPLVMTVTVRATQVNGIMPRAVVFDEDGNPVPALVLAHGDGTATIQVAAVPPGTNYFVMVSADPTAGKAVGNYDLDVEFGDVAASPTTFVASSMDAALSQESYGLVVTQTQLFDWLLAAPAAAAPSSGVVRMDIVNSAGQVVATRSAAVGDTSGGDPVLLSPGIYQVRFVAASTGNAPLPSMAFQMYGASLSDPIGPALDDPTLNPVATPATGALATALPAVLGASGSPYYWLALGLNGRDGPGSIAGQDLAPSVGGTTFTTLAAPGTAGALGNGVSGATSANGSVAPTVALAGLNVSAGAVAPRVVVTYALNRALLLTSLITLGSPTELGPAGPPTELPGAQEGTAGDGKGIARIAPEVPTDVARAGPQGSQVPAPLVPDTPSSVPGPSLRKPSAPDEFYVSDEEERVGCDVAEIAAILGITAILYRCVHRGQTETSPEEKVDGMAIDPRGAGGD